MNTMTYKGYTARVEFDGRGNIFVGHLLGIADVIGFHADNVANLRAAFEDAVEDYLETCAALGKSPEKPASGKLMLCIRAGEEAENNRGLSPNTPTNTPEPLWGTDDFRAILGRTQIDYDPDKEKINRKKHGYSLESAVYFLTGLIIPGAYRPFLSRKVLEKTK
jgi:predicted HicB family RNase H-like nuclease